MKKKQSLIQICLLVALLLSLPAAVQAQTYTNSYGIWSYTDNGNGTATITGYTGSGGAVTIPSTINVLSVTGIASEAFYDNTSLTSVTIPNSITNIGDEAFEDCIYLNAITVNSGNPAYISVAGVLFNTNQTTLIQYPLHKSGTSYTIPNSVTTIGDGAFAVSDYLTSITIPNGVTTIGSGAFYFCPLTSVTIPNSVTTIGGGAFEECVNMTTATIGTGLANLESYAFSECGSLTSVYFQGNAPISYGVDLFYGTHNLTVYYYAGTSGWDSFPATTVMLNAPNPNGSLQVTIGPAGAVTAGAYWQVDGGIAQPSGATVLGLSVGNHTVSFSAVSGWTTPSNQIVSVSANSTATTSGTYVVFIPVQVTTTALPNGANGVAYSQQLSAIYGQPPYIWSAFSGSLPPGLTLATSGLIYGTPTNDGSFNFTVEVTDALSMAATQLLTLTVGSYPSVAWIQPTNSSVAAPVGSNVTFSVSVTGTGPFSYQWQLDGTNLPNGIGIINTVAGNGTNGYSGDGGMATNAELSYPWSVAVDASDNTFIADSANFRVRKVGINGIITTVAGNGTNGYSGDGGPATNAELREPFGMAVDASGNLLVSDLLNQDIRKVGPNGIITTVAGNETAGYSGDGGAATNAELYWPEGVAVDASGNLFISDAGNQRIRKLGTNGIITTVAGNGTYGFSGDGGAATNAQLDNPVAVAIDATGNLFISDDGNQRIRKVGTNGIIITVAGDGYAGYYGDGGAATNAYFADPAGLAVDAIGNLFIADVYNNRVREVGINGIITTAAGNGGEGYSGDGGAATNAELYYPEGVAVDANNNLFIADYYNYRIRKVTFQSPTLVLNDVAAGNAGAYDVIISSQYGSVTSSVVNLTIMLPNTIQYTANPTNGATPLAVQFDSPDVDSGGKTINSWNWNFGDGGTSTLQNPSHTYTTVGSFTPALIATNVNGVTVIGSGPQITTLTATSPTNFIFTTNSGAIIITGYTGPGGTVVIPATINGYPVTTIGEEAFAYSSLTSVTIPNSVTSIGEAAFYSCYDLTSVMLPSSVTAIGIEALAQCRSLTAITVTAGNPAYRSMNGVLFNYNQNTLVEFPAGVVGSYTIPSGVTTIGEAAFYSGSLATVTIPNSVTNIGEYAFSGGNLTAITVDAQNLFYSSVNGVLFNKYQTTLVEYPGESAVNYAIPNSVTNIEVAAFYAMYGLTNVNIPNSVTSIGDSAFFNSGLNSLIIPNGVTSIGDYAFAYCFDLTTAYFLGNAPSLDSTVFYDDPVTIYYLPGTTGWAELSADTGLSTTLWYQPNPAILGSGSGLGVQNNQFGFTISWATNLFVIVQACTNLTNPVWTPVSTNTLSNGTNYFSDPHWTNYSRRFYRISAP